MVHSLSTGRNVPDDPCWKGGRARVRSAVGVTVPRGGRGCHQITLLIPGRETGTAMRSGTVTRYPDGIRSGEFPARRRAGSFPAEGLAMQPPAVLDRIRNTVTRGVQMNTSGDIITVHRVLTAVAALSLLWAAQSSYGAGSRLPLAGVASVIAFVGSIAIVIGAT